MSVPPDPAGQPGRSAARMIAATGGSVAAERIDHLDCHQAPPLGVSWPVQVGQIPALASAFQGRSALREQVDAARSSGGGAVLTQVLSGGGGVGKSQLAARYAHDALGAGTDLVVWTDASQAGAVVEVFARAAVRVQAAGAGGGDAEADAREFLAWAAATSRSWLVVLDDIADPGLLNGWWPASHTGTGWVLATTRRHDAVLAGSGQVLIDVDVYTPAESQAYLTDRLTTAGARLLDGRAGELAGELGHLPLALCHAAAYLIDQQISCATYLDRYVSGRDRLDDLMPASADADGYGRTVGATLLLALDAADAREPAGLACPAIRLAGVLDPAGHPAALWTTEAVTSYLAQYRTGPDRRADPEPSPGSAPEAVTSAQAREALVLLHRYGLATFDEDAESRAVRVHALTARAARETAPAGQVPAIAQAAADALLAVWPDPDYTDPALADSLRASTTALAACSGDALWHPDGHPVLYRAGNSMLDAGLHTEAIAHWQQVAADSVRILGPVHPDTLTAQANLASSYWQAGRTAHAITLGELVADDMARILGPEHPDTLTAQANLASSYQEAGRTADAITLGELVADDMARILGPEHPSTLAAQGILTLSYEQARRTAYAITIEERVAADRARILGPEHPRTLTAQGILAATYCQARRTADAISLGERVADDMARILGPEHPSTLTAEGILAFSYEQAGRTADAITILERVAADSARILGSEHPDTVAAVNVLREWTRRP